MYAGHAANDASSCGDLLNGQLIPAPRDWLLPWISETFRCVDLKTQRPVQPPPQLASWILNEVFLYNFGLKILDEKIAELVT
jgi:hypothetical protein